MKVSLKKIRSDKQEKMKWDFLAYIYIPSDQL